MTLITVTDEKNLEFTNNAPIRVLAQMNAMCGTTYTVENGRITEKQINIGGEGEDD